MAKRKAIGVCTRHAIDRLIKQYGVKKNEAKNLIRHTLKQAKEYGHIDGETSYRITIPPQLARRYGISKEQRVFLVVEHERVVTAEHISA